MKTRADIVKDLAPNSIVMELGVAAGCFAIDMFKTNPNIQYIGSSFHGFILSHPSRQLA